MKKESSAIKGGQTLFTRQGLLSSSQLSQVLTSLLLFYSDLQSLTSSPTSATYLCNLLPVTCNLLPATCNLLPATCNPVTCNNLQPCKPATYLLPSNLFSKNS
ncbi:hypothetical protein AMTR_s00018p00049780 [Amborella trichopoda]|uniref:Uncharacterized protein n=1 Tax=Amborella trichopoda TaxID=13333 RepID=W1PJD0_AMBTC|nr:hypothetical protein AMTR_s00018p00049780 [Amborella trichopoda]